MPLKQCVIDGKSGWKWGDSGKCYVDGSDEKNKKDALKQASAIAISKGIDINDYIANESSYVFNRNIISVVESVLTEKEEDEKTFIVITPFKTDARYTKYNSDFKDAEKIVLNLSKELKFEVPAEIREYSGTVIIADMDKFKPNKITTINSDKFNKTYFEIKAFKPLSANKSYFDSIERIKKSKVDTKYSKLYKITYNSKLKKFEKTEVDYNDYDITSFYDDYRKKIFSILPKEIDTVDHSTLFVNWFRDNEFSREFLKYYDRILSKKYHKIYVSKSGSRGRVASYYYEIPNKNPYEASPYRLRLSDHELPDTLERQHNRQLRGVSWDIDIAIDATNYDKILKIIDEEIKELSENTGKNKTNNKKDNLRDMKNINFETIARELVKSAVREYTDLHFYITGVVGDDKIEVLIDGKKYTYILPNSIDLDNYVHELRLWSNKDPREALKQLNDISIDSYEGDYHYNEPIDRLY